MIQRLLALDQWKFFAILPRADRPLAVAWWAVLVLRGVLPALFAIVIGTLVGAVQRGDDLLYPLVLVGVVFVPLQVLSPLHHVIGANLGSRTAGWLYDRLTAACVRPPGMGHLENPELTTDLTMARDFDLGITGPPMSISMDFIASGLVEMVAGLASAAVLAGFSWWAPLLLAGAGWPRTGSCVRAPSGGIATPRKSAPRSGTPTMPIAWRSNRMPRRNSGSSDSAAGSWSGSDRGVACFSTCNGRPRGSANGPWPGAWCWWFPPTSWCSGRWRVRPLTARSGSTGW